MKESNGITRITLSEAKKIRGKSNIAKLHSEQRQELAAIKSREPKKPNSR